jgi:predicted esterase
MRCASEIVAWGVLLLVSCAAADAADAGGAFDGKWYTSIGVVALEQRGDDVTGTYGDQGQFNLKGAVAGRKLTFEYREGPSTGDAHWTLDDSGHSFRGGFRVRGGRAGQWNGWRPDPRASDGERADVAGLWLTDFGLMELEQAGDKAQGRYASRGGSEIEGTVTGRRFEFAYKSFRRGTGWFDVAGDGSTLAGAANAEGFPGWYGWRGRRAPEFARHAPLVPGKVVDGSTAGLLTYAARAPEGYVHGDGKKWPAVVVLHGSNMNGRAYVGTIAAAWPDVARDYLLVGINGETPSHLGGAGDDEPRFNYTYVSYVGRSTFKGFPGTDRESPALVAEALADLRAAYPISHYFVGGHSQGGFLTYSLLMNFPEAIAGAFPISAGVIFQAEPSAFADEPLRAAQRAVPLAIVHGKQDRVVAFSSGEYAATLFGEAGWPAFRFLADDTGAGHMFARLPVGEAIRWLEAHASDDPAKLLDFAEQRLRAGGYRDAVAAVNRVTTLAPADPGVTERLDRLTRQIEAKAGPPAAEFLPRITAAAAASGGDRDGNGDEGDDGKRWIDDFLAYRDDFEFAPAAADVMRAFAALRAEHEGSARTAVDEARAAFQHGRRDDGYAKYRQVVDEHYAASSYRNVKRWLAERK